MQKDLEICMYYYITFCVCVCAVGQYSCSTFLVLRHQEENEQQTASILTLWAYISKVTNVENSLRERSTELQRNINIVKAMNRSTTDNIDHMKSEIQDVQSEMDKLNEVIDTMGANIGEMKIECTQLHDSLEKILLDKHSFEQNLQILKDLDEAFINIQVCDYFHYFLILFYCSSIQQLVLTHTHIIVVVFSCQNYRSMWGEWHRVT